MFGASSKIKALEERLSRMEEELWEVRDQVRNEMQQSLARLEQDPTKRLGMLVESVETTLAERVEALEPRVANATSLLDHLEAELAPVRSVARHSPAFSVEHTAQYTGLLGFWFRSGYTDSIELFVNGKSIALVGTDEGSFSIVIRSGEQYRMQSDRVAKGKKIGWKSIFTPFAP